MNKKAQALSISNLPTIALMIGLAAVGLAIVAAVLTGVNDSLDTTTDTLIANDTATGSSSNISLTGRNIDPSTFQVSNASVDGAFWTMYEYGSDCTDFTSQTVPVFRCGNYTLYTEPGIIFFNQTDAQKGTVRMNYTYAKDNELAVISNGTEAGIANLSDQFGLLGTIVILVVILGVVIGIFAIPIISRKGEGGVI